MTHVTIDDVQHLARLSSLSLSDGETESLRGDLEQILGYIEQLGELDTAGVDPTYQVTDLENVWRDDIVQTHEVKSEQLIALASQHQENQIKVPKVL